MNKEELKKEYQKIVLETNGGNNDYVVALCKIANAINNLDEPKQQINSLNKSLKKLKHKYKNKCKQFLALKEYIKDIYNINLKIYYSNSIKNIVTEEIK